LFHLFGDNTRPNNININNPRFCVKVASAIPSIKKNKKIKEEIDITDEKSYEDMDIEEQQQSDHETEDDYTDTEREDQ